MKIAVGFILILGASGWVDAMDLTNVMHWVGLVAVVSAACSLFYSARGTA